MRLAFVILAFLIMSACNEPDPCDDAAVVIDAGSDDAGEVD